jgi:predicted ATP-dependent endonuclease of OLD family
MQLIIQNFGPIKDGKIDFSKKFFVFVGYNNSGKTYMSQLLWAIFNEETIEKFSQSVEFEELIIEKPGTFEINPTLIENILAKFAGFLISDIIPKTFNLNREHFHNIFLDFQYDINRIKRKSLNVKFARDDKAFFVFSKEKNSLMITIEEKSFSNAVFSFFENGRKSSELVEFVLRLLFDNLHQTVFLPASRLFYLIFYQYIYRLEKEKRQKMTQRVREYLHNDNSNKTHLESLLSSFKSPYTESMNWLFDKIYGLNESAVVKSHYEALIAELTRIMEGDIVMRKSEGIAPIEFYLKMLKPNKKLPMYLSSSSVNQLSTLYLYFKYWANPKNNFLMIDEPEENLHPKNQMALLNVLLKFANENDNRVLITTHSPFLADMINNYLYLAFLKSKSVSISHQMENYPEMNLDIDLMVEDIGIYFFDGDQIKTYQMGEYGVLFEDFNYEIRKSHKIRDLLTDQIYCLINNNDD